MLILRCTGSLLQDLKASERQIYTERVWKIFEKSGFVQLNYYHYMNYEILLYDLHLHATLRFFRYLYI